METLGFIGVGNIATAIIKSVLNSGYITPDKICLFDTDEQKSAGFQTAYGVRVATAAVDVVKQCDCVIIAVKPSVVESVLKTISPVVSSQCIVSVAAGISLSFIGSHLPKGTSVIRVMPNTPLMYGNGAAAYSVNASVTSTQAAFVEKVFSSSGYAAQVDETLLNSVTAVSGSSPAFVFRFMRDIIEEGMAQGLPQAVAEQLVIQTVIGSAVMLCKSELTADQLIRMVASPNGTTEAGLSALDSAGFDASVKGAVNSAYRRSIELTK
ncbi:MAG: pyrroline-5-carboxylate reductase [Clostridia bacterium]|nr:pyrroline-5-carboxylate reductase [Clostridia bacterium]MBQ7289083.1 pyrroline-5-carboxylate reductase [Clostridia bacterium]